jgi:hypothetical protein
METEEKQAKAAQDTQQQAPIEKTESKTPQADPKAVISYSQVDLSADNLQAELDALYGPKGEPAATEKSGGGEEKKAEPVVSDTVGEEPPVEETTEEAPPEEEPEAPAVEAEETGEPEEAPAVERELAEPPESERFRFKDDRDRAIAAMKRANKHLSWAEVEQIVDSVREDRPRVTEQEAPTNEAIQEINSRLAEIDAELDQMSEQEVLYGPEVQKRQKEARQLESKRTKLEIKAERQAEVAQEKQAKVITTFQSTRETSRSEVLKQYPALAKKETPQAKALAEYLKELNNPEHPDHSLLTAARAPELVLPDVIKRNPKLFGKPAVSSSPSPATKPTVTQDAIAKAPAQTARAKVNPPSGSHKTVEVTVNPKEVTKSLIEEAPLEDSLAALYGSNTKPAGNPFVYTG